MEDLYMKKQCGLFILALSFTALVGCGGSYKVPSSGYEKVKTAFNGVEKSFKKAQASKKSLNYKAPQYKNEYRGLSTIFSLFNESDIQGHDLEDLEYGQPPMIQFQYLKGVFDKVGSGYEFGTKYYDNVTGEMYMDIYDGLQDKSQKPENRYTYDFELAISINIDENDLINADVSFDIELKQGEDTYTSKWYVNLLLDYDMEKASPNYTLTMYTENDETDLPYYEHFTYEYDYVNVQDNKISEWRKFCMDADERLIKNNQITDFSFYLERDTGIFAYEVDEPKWFVNNNFYKKNNMSEQQDELVASALFEDIGLNANDINADAFFEKQGNRNPVIKEMYSKFSQIRGDDIIYDLMCKEEDDHGGEMQEISTIVVMNEDGTGKAENHSIPDVVVGDLFTDGYTDPNEQTHIVFTLWYGDQNMNPISKIDKDESGSFSYYLMMRKSSTEEATPSPTPMDFTENISAFYSKFKGEVEFVRELRLYIMRDNLVGYMDFNYVGDLPEQQKNNTFPKALLDLGIPEYPTYGYSSFILTENNGVYELTITDVAPSDYNHYTSVLMGKADFYQRRSSPNSYNFRKDYGEDKYVLVTVNLVSDSEAQIIARVTEKRNGIDYFAAVGDMNEWNNQTSNARYLFAKNDEKENEHILYNLQLQAGYKFKFVANGDWHIANANRPYGGYGYDDVANISSYSTYFQEADEADSNIEVLKDCTLTITAVIDNNGEVSFNFSTSK